MLNPNQQQPPRDEFNGYGSILDLDEICATDCDSWQVEPQQQQVDLLDLINLIK